MKKLKIILMIGIIFTTINSCNIVQAAKLDNNTRIGWQSLNGHWYYLNKNGVKSTGWQAIDGAWYYLKADGTMAIGWQSIGGHWYYLNNSGVMTTGWQSIDGHWYYLNEGGAMLTGWQAIDGAWYYLKANGTMAIGWQSLGGQKYYLNKSGIMLTGCQHIDGKTYNFEKNGQLIDKTEENTSKKVIEEAKKHIGKPYQWGATGPERFDCSGFTKYVFNKFKYEIGRTTYDQINVGKPVSRNNLKPGDLVFSGGSASSPSHVGIYVGDGEIIHSPRTGECVKISKMYHYVAARRVLL